MYKNEREIAKKAEQMLENSLRNKIHSLAIHLNGNDDSESMADATAKSRVKKYGNRKNGKDYMTSLAIKMVRHGFIQHFGIDTVRAGSTRNRKTPKNVTYGFKSHVMKMKAKPFINEAVDRSGVVPFVMENVNRIRSEELIYEVKKILENK